jgi:hypothetical protein
MLSARHRAVTPRPRSTTLRTPPATARAAMQQGPPRALNEDRAPRTRRWRLNLLEGQGAAPCAFSPDLQSVWHLNWVQPQEDRSCRRKSGSEGSKRGLALRAAAGTAAVAVLLALVTPACGGATSSQSSSSATQSHMLQKVTSTLDGETTIPLRTRWIATPQPAGAPVAEVDMAEHPYTPTERLSR